MSLRPKRCAGTCSSFSLRTLPNPPPSLCIVSPPLRFFFPLPPLHLFKNSHRGLFPKLNGLTSTVRERRIGSWGPPALAAIPILTFPPVSPSGFRPDHSFIPFPYSYYILSLAPVCTSRICSPSSFVKTESDPKDVRFRSQVNHKTCLSSKTLQIIYICPAVRRRNIWSG